MRILCVFGQHAYGDRHRGISYELNHFMPALKAMGHDVELFDSWNRTLYSDFSALNKALVKRVANRRPALIFTVLMGYEIWTETLEHLRTHTCAKIVNWGTDDSWKYEQFSRNLAHHVDLHVTTSAAAANKAHAEGLRNVYLSQWAANHETLAEPLPAEQCRYAVSFVGSAYGNRQHWVDALEKRGIKVECFGHGWTNGPVDAREIPQIMRESIVSLNFGDSGIQFTSGKPYRSRQIKARIFEVPGAGGLLFTEPADDLEQFYEPEKEIVLFSNADELTEKIHYFIAHPDERNHIANAGHEKTRAYHTYTRRFSEILSVLENLRPQSSTRCALEFDAPKLYKRGRFERLLRLFISAPFILMLGKKRGPRAARRLVFELSWRMCPEATYSARGWPGRLFYEES